MVELVTRSKVLPSTNRKIMLPRRWSKLEWRKSAVMSVHNLKRYRSAGVKARNPMRSGKMKAVKVTRKQRMIDQLEAFMTVELPFASE